MHKPFAEFKVVTKCFKKLCALQDVEFALAPGEIFGFIGPNGAGKTTTVRLMLGFYAPTHGTVRILGCDPVTEFHRLGGQVGIMLEQPGILQRLTAREYLEYFGALVGFSRGDMRLRAAELLEMVQLPDRADSRLAEFSKGMRQRISLARCLLSRPRLIILDEPFDGLDIETRCLIRDTLPQVCENQGTAVFITSHNLPEIEEISDTVAIIKQGHILAVDRTDALKSRVANPNILIVSLSGDYDEEKLTKLVPDANYRRRTRDLVLNLNDSRVSRDEFLMQLLRAGISVRSVCQKTPSLEDVYFALTKAPLEGRAS